MRRLISIILLLATLFGLCLPIAGCSEKKNGLRMGQWLSLLTDSFGITDYSEETPFFPKVNASNQYFGVFQAAAEWDILEPSDNISHDTPVTWNDALITLVNAGEFTDIAATDEEKINYAIQTFDNKIRSYWGNRAIKLNKAVELLDIAQDLWVNKTYTETIQQITYADGVKDYTKSEVEYTLDGDKITILSSQLTDLKAGDVFTLPGNDFSSAGIYRADSVEMVGGNLVITNDESFTSDEAMKQIGNLRVQETSAPNFSQITGVYDENGNLVPCEVVDEISPVSDIGSGVYVTQLNSNGNEGEFVQTDVFKNAKKKFVLKIKEYAIEVTLSGDSVKVELNKELKENSAIGSGIKQTSTTKAFGSIEFKDVELTKDIDFSWGELKSATVKVSYKTTIEGGVSFERENAVGDSGIRNDDGVKNPLSSILNDYKQAVKSLEDEVKNQDVSDEFYICSIPLAEGGFASVNFVIKGKVTAEGTVKVVLELEGAQGIQYKSGKLRYIKSKNVDINFVAEAKLEVTMGFGFEITILKKWALIDLMLDLGVGASIEKTTHLFDVEGHCLYSNNTEIGMEGGNALADDKMLTSAEDILAFAEQQGMTWNNYEKGVAVELQPGVCYEWKLYPIVRVGLGGSTLVGKLAKNFKLTVSLEICGSKTPFLSGHIDFPNNLLSALNSGSVGGGIKALLGIGAECVYDFTPWDTVEEIEETSEPTAETEGGTDEENEGILTADFIVLSTMRIFLEPGQGQVVEITALPAGYNLLDLEIIIEDKSIATVNPLKRSIVGKSEGTTQIIVQTKDGKYKTICAVTVTAPVTNDFQGLSNNSEHQGVIITWC